VITRKPICERCQKEKSFIDNDWLEADNPKSLCLSCATEWSVIYKKNDLSADKNLEKGRKLFKKFMRSEKEQVEFT
jgi:hypothetical protein